MKIVLKNSLVDYYLICKWTTGFLDKSLSLLMPKKAVGSLTLMSEREELQHFLNMRHNISTLFKIYGTELISGQFLNSSSFNVIISILKKI